MQRIHESDIQLGQPLPWDCFDQHSLLLLRKGVVVNSKKQVQGLIERGLFIEQTPEEAPPPSAPSPFHLLEDFQIRLKAIFHGIIYRQGDDLPERVIKLCKELQDLCETDSDAVLAMFHTDVEGRYTLTHPLAVAALSELIVKRKGVSPEERLPILAASLTANVAMIDLQETLQKQETPLTDEQREAIRLHPLQAAELLTESGVQDQVWIKTVLHHHEKLDGSGYLGALRGEDIPLSVRIVSLADSYSAMIAPRVYRDQILAKDALRDIFLKRGVEVDEELAQLFIKELGVFPPGAFVRLANGEIAIVIKRGAAGNCPVVQSVMGPRGAPLLAPVRRDTTHENYAIREMVARYKGVNIDMHRLWGYK